jgi:hypothetical protein
VVGQLKPGLVEGIAHRPKVVLLQLKRGGVAKAWGEGEKEKDCTTGGVTRSQGSASGFSEVIARYSVSKSGTRFPVSTFFVCSLLTPSNATHVVARPRLQEDRGGFTTRRRNVTSSRGGQKGDLQIQNIDLAGKTHLVIDVALVHDFSGDCWRDVSRNGQLRYADPDMLLNNAADVKVRKYREAYAAPDRLLAFLPTIMSTSGRSHGEFLRLLHILSHCQAVNRSSNSSGKSQLTMPSPSVAPRTSSTTARP